MKCKDCIHCQWDDECTWCDAYEKRKCKSNTTLDTSACEFFSKQIPYTCGECRFNIKAAADGDLDFCAVHDLYDFTQFNRKACSDFENLEGLQ